MSYETSIILLCLPALCIAGGAALVIYAALVVSGRLSKSEETR